jgi:hypothetical protein
MSIDFCSSIVTDNIFVPSPIKTGFSTHLQRWQNYRPSNEKEPPVGDRRKEGVQVSQNLRRHTSAFLPAATPA